MSITVTDNTADNSVTQAAARPRLGTDKTNAASLINEDEDITIYGNVGTKVIDVNGGASAYEIVQAINAQQGETGVYAAAQTRVNLSFADQDQAKKDTVTFNLYGKNTDTPYVVSANVDFGVTNGRDASLELLQMPLTQFRVKLVLPQRLALRVQWYTCSQMRAMIL